MSWSRRIGSKEEVFVLVLNPDALFGIAALIGSLSALVWAVRRKP